jgi:hypothetical protein
MEQFQPYKYNLLPKFGFGICLIIKNVMKIVIGENRDFIIINRQILKLFLIKI